MFCMLKRIYFMLEMKMKKYKTSLYLGTLGEYFSSHDFFKYQKNAIKSFLEEN